MILNVRTSNAAGMLPGKASSEGIILQAFPAVLKDGSRLRPKGLVFGLHAPEYVQKILGDVARVGLQSGEAVTQDGVVFGLRSACHSPDRSGVPFTRSGGA